VSHAGNYSHGSQLDQRVYIRNTDINKINSICGKIPHIHFNIFISSETGIF